MKRTNNVADITKTRVLCVGRNKSLLALRSMVLQRAGFEVTTTSSVADAVQACSQPAFDVVVVCHSLGLKTSRRLASKFVTLAPAAAVVLMSEWENLDLYQIREPNILLQVVDDFSRHRPADAT